MPSSMLPPGQHEIEEIMRWNIDHPGILPQNPKFDPKEWKLVIDGTVKTPITIGWKDLLDLPFRTIDADFHCVEGWSVKNCSWTGVLFNEVTKRVQPKKDVEFVLLSCADGYTTSLSLKDINQESVLLAYKLNGKLLPESLGSPLRLITLDKYAYKSPMWLLRITFLKTQELGYWEKRGYSGNANIWENDRFARK